MSWDLFVMDLPPVDRVEQIPDDWEGRPLGTRAEVIATICEAAPIADFADPAWGRIEGDRFSIEVNLGAGDPVISFALHVRGADRIVPIVCGILETGGWRALDSQTGDFFSPAEAPESFTAWRAWRNRVLAGPPGD